VPLFVQCPASVPARSAQQRRCERSWWYKSCSKAPHKAKTVRSPAPGRRCSRRVFPPTRFVLLFFDCWFGQQNVLRSCGRRHGWGSSLTAWPAWPTVNNGACYTPWITLTSQALLLARGASLDESGVWTFSSRATWNLLGFVVALGAELLGFWILPGGVEYTAVYGTFVRRRSPNPPASCSYPSRGSGLGLRLVAGHWRGGPGHRPYTTDGDTTISSLPLPVCPLLSPPPKPHPKMSFGTLTLTEEHPQILWPNPRWSRRAPQLSKIVSLHMSRVRTR